MKKISFMFLMCFALLGCETADGVASGVKSVLEGVSEDIESVRNKY